MVLCNDANLSGLKNDHSEVEFSLRAQPLFKIVYPFYLTTKEAKDLYNTVEVYGLT